MLAIMLSNRSRGSRRRAPIGTDALAARAGLVAAVALACSLPACKKASKEKRRDQPVTQKPFLAGHNALTGASPTGDILTVLLRFDHLHAAGLDDEVDALVGILPDHRRVFGGSGEEGITGSFDVVYISTVNPTWLTASTLAARALRPSRMQSMLAYPDAGVTWRKGPGGPIGELTPTQRFQWYDSRVYLMPGDPWIVLSKPDRLGALYDPAATEKPVWLGGLEALARLGPPDDRPGQLLAVATATNLPERAVVPAVGAVAMPTRMIAAATARDGTVTFTGDMTFANEDHARAATDAVATLRKRFERFRPVREAKVWREGATILWSSRASVAETGVLVGLVASLVQPMFPKGSLYAPPPPVPPGAGK